MSTAEHERLKAYRLRQADWKHWGPYLAERAWGTVREDYSRWGSAWDYFPHDHARSRAYRWNEDGLMGICDRHQHLCFALALWNGEDAILKERLYGLSGTQGNHAEDVKEYYFYLDSTPTHSYMKMLYKYPQRAFPYADLVTENARRSAHDWEYELLDTGIFDEDAYFDVSVEYAKAGEFDLLVQFTVTNRGQDDARCVLLPTLWFRNTWSWGYEAGPQGLTPNKPHMQQVKNYIETQHPTFGTYYLYADDTSQWLFTENETNNQRLHDTDNASPYVKDAFHAYLVDQQTDAVNPDKTGTKAAAIHDLMVGAGESVRVRLRLSRTAHAQPFADFDALLTQRQRESDTFYAAIQHESLDEDARNVQRQAFAGMLWTKQLYYLDMEQWIRGDPIHPPQREHTRNSQWRHLANFDVISMPDKWEYPWYATWDTAFHCLPLMLIDPDYAKRQLELPTREWYMHPNGQLPAYEWHFDDVNPPVHAWSIWKLYEIDGDRDFLERMYHKMLLNFTWWVNQKDLDGNNVFEGGFLGLDNISVFDRSSDLPGGGHIDQSDGTAWMGFYSIKMMRMALELAKENPSYEDLAVKFFEHFLRIATAMSNADGMQPFSLWDEQDGFFYDVLHLPDDITMPVRVRSLVGLLPLISVEIIEHEIFETKSTFYRRTHWFMENRPHLTGNMASIDDEGQAQCHLMAMLTKERLLQVLHYMLDEDEFLSPYGIRSLSKYHEDNPYTLEIDGQVHTVRYLPSESDNMMFGGNSNWRGPIWFPINYLLIEALRKFHRYYGDSLQVEFPTHSGNYTTLDVVADDLSRRLVALFLHDDGGKRPINGGQAVFDDNPHWREHVLFYEYFNGDNGAGLGASHQTGWTGLVANLIQGL